MRKLLLPLSLFFAPIVAIRNFLYDQNILKSRSFDCPVLVVGNLTTGGSGKTPMVEYLIRCYLNNGFSPIVLSRGYGRKTKGFLEVETHSQAQIVGDEPLQIKKKFPQVPVFVCENRVKGIEVILENNKAQGKFVIICDDAFQHRRLKAGYSVLLWTLEDVQSEKWLLPAGNFREFISGRLRSDIQVVTKVPQHTPNTILSEVEDELEFDETPVFFSKTSYGSFYDFSGNPIFFEEANVLLVTGIANPKPLQQYLSSIGISAAYKTFPDHHNFTQKEIAKIVDTFQEKKFDYVLFTEKDYVRIQSNWPQEVPAIYLTIRCEIMRDTAGFERRILAFAERYYA